MSLDFVSLHFLIYMLSTIVFGLTDINLFFCHNITKERDIDSLDIYGSFLLYHLSLSEAHGSRESFFALHQINLSDQT